VEAALVEIALDDLAVDLAFGERAGPMRARVVGDIETPGQVEDGQHEVVVLDLQRTPLRHLVGIAKSNQGRDVGHWWVHS
jgi:hypothetical protein